MEARSARERNEEARRPSIRPSAPAGCAEHTDANRSQAQRTAVKVSIASRAQALILARPGPLREALETLVASIPGIVVLAGASVTVWPTAAAAPDLILMDTDLSRDDECITFVQIRDQWPRARLVLLTDGDRTSANGTVEADAVLMKGTPAARLVGMLEGLLTGVREERGHIDGAQRER